MGEGRDGDWDCSSCNNRNYAFRSFCNRCKQPRILVDTKTPSDSKWLPRIGDWICTGCTNNNYASRERCKKCGQPKEIAAMPAIAMTGASFPTYPHYFSRAPGGPDQKMNIGLIGNGAGAPPQSLHLGSNWSMFGSDKYGGQPLPLWLLGANYSSGLPVENSTSQNLSVPKGWRNGDWICNCGFHNYSSRSQTNDQVVGTSGDPKPGVLSSFPSINSSIDQNLPIPTLFPPPVSAPALLGKGAKQWRSGDWMCTNCNNHNYASRLQCNRCKTQRVPPVQPSNAL
ncbi:hypothetical protein PIB30_060717 [Stylosanthes scabra]|uniref:RanBP2-type domain-containing protein n=1 Tax=Stylosanthes scabra TaxID=79078 RepID=A0ABU6XLY6_9FABA|nr:hypothetical protein [Stylosanthes scabra]